ncbi:gas vesicle protein GvpO [Streptomyces sp. NPDC047024]|uniref:gas vesicle protein GvpO n=1 Tax=Streptomyces sp. NPDC047024 TaxID=3155476 RepID=UPI003409CCDA
MSSNDDESQKDGKHTQERLDLPTVVSRASSQLSALLQREAGAVSAVRATDDGWSAEVEVVELERVPDTMSVMASYRIELDHRGRLLGYERLRRYARGQIDRR